MKRFIKQTIIIIAVLLFVTTVIGGLLWLFRVKPTCFDGIKNQEEEGIDCGSICEKSCPRELPKITPLKVANFEIVKGGNKCDLVVVVENPNSSLGAQQIPYSIKWNQVVKRGEFYIYPSEKRYLTEINMDCQNGEPELTIGDPPSWEFFRGYEKPNLEFSDYKLNYTNTSGSYEFAELKGIISNKSPFDLKSVEIYAVIKDSGGETIAVNKTTVNSILVSERREFRIFWTHSFPEGGVPTLFTTTNLFNSENFLKRYGAESAKWKMDVDDNMGFSE